MHYLKFNDITPDRVTAIIERASVLKKIGGSDAMKGTHTALIFEKPSLRTKLSFAIGINKLGGSYVYFSPEEVGLGKREPVQDVARVVSRMADAIVVRTFAHSTIEQFAEGSSIPVVNALTDAEHPCQALADILTIQEVFGSLSGIQVAFIGDGNNVATSLAFALAGMGGRLVVASPPGYGLTDATLEAVNIYGRPAGGEAVQVVLPSDAIKASSVVYTDVWTSMGEEAEAENRREVFKDYIVTPKLMESAKDEVRFMHDMPAHPGEEIEEGMLYHPSSICFQQAENRLWAQMALLEMLI